MRHGAIVGIVLIVLAQASGLCAADKSEDVFKAPAAGWPADAKKGLVKSVKVEGLTEENAFFHLMVPDNYAPDKAWPVVIVLHGGPGGKAIDLASVFALGLKDLGAISVYPQALKSVMLEWNYPHEGAYLLAIIRQVSKSYRVDPARIYLMGHSMGGGGTWCEGAVLNSMWAAIGPISGWYGASPKPNDQGLKNLPVYCLHGDADQSVPVDRSRLGDAALKKIGNADYVYRELPGVGHIDILTKQKPELLKMAKWLLDHKRSSPADFATAERQLADWGKPFGWLPDGGIVGHYKEDAKTGANKTP